jgi:hypothetical protein
MTTRSIVLWLACATKVPGLVKLVITSDVVPDEGSY